MNATILLQSAVFIYLCLCAASVAFVLAWQDAGHRDSLVDFLAAWVTWLLSSVVISEIILGALGVLRVSALVVVFSAAAVVAWLFFVKRGGVLLAPSGWRLSCRRIAAVLADGRVPLALVLVPLLAGAFTITALVEPSALFDSYVYHLPMPVDWLQHGALTPTYIGLAEVSNSYFPGNVELLYFWTLAPFRNDLLVRLVPIGMWLVFGLALWRLCRQSGAGRTSAAIAVTIFLFTPLMLSQSTELWTDGAAAALFVLALGHLYAYARRPSMWSAVLFGLAGGLFLGVKYSGPAYLVILLIAFVLVGLTRRGSQPIAFFLRSSAVVVLAVAAAGSYWYLRNLLTAGNPVYPLSVGFAGRTIFPGPGTPCGETLWHAIGRLRLPDVLFALASGYGPFFFLASGVAIIGVARGLRNARGLASPACSPLRRRWLGLMFGLLVITLVIYVHTPYSVMLYCSDEPITPIMLSAGMRFSLIAGACATVLIALSLDNVRKLGNFAWVLAIFALVAACLIGYDTKNFNFVPSRIFTLPRFLVSALLITIVLFVVAALQWLNRAFSPRGLPRPRMGYFLVGVLPAVVLIGMAIAELEQYRDVYRYAVYRDRFGDLAVGWSWLDKNINNARVAYVGDPRMLVAYGADFSNQVRYVNIAGDLEDRFDDFYRRGEDYRGRPRYRTWLANLTRWSADYLVIVLPVPVLEDKWAAAHPETFTRVYARDPWRIYRITDAPVATAPVP